jgi:hypothetical protein
MSEQKPSVGRVVHYVSHGTPNGEYLPECRAAIVTAVDQYQPAGEDDRFIGHVDLCVLNPTGMFFKQGVHQDEGDGVLEPSDFRPAQCNGLSHKGGTWHWPERVS